MKESPSAIKLFSRGNWLYFLVLSVTTQLSACSPSASPGPARGVITALEKHGVRLVIDDASITVAGETPEMVLDAQALANISTRQFLPGSLFTSFPLHNGEVNALVVSKNGERIFSAGSDGQLFMTTHRGGGATRPTIESKRILVSERAVLALALSHNERFLAVAQNSLVLIVDLENRTIAHYLTRVPGRIAALSWDPRDELVVLGRSDGDVFVWNLVDGDYAGENSPKALEPYQGGVSQIVRILFHPRGRIFFTIEREGRVTLWKLLRSDREIGLRDEGSKFDRENSEPRQIAFASIGVRTEDAWLSPTGEVLMVFASDGLVYRFKIRGLVNLGTAKLVDDDVSAVTQFTLSQPNEPGGLPPRLLATTSRGQRLTVWCLDDFSSGARGSASLARLARTRPLTDPSPVPFTRFPGRVEEYRVLEDLSREPEIEPGESTSTDLRTVTESAPTTDSPTITPIATSELLAAPFGEIGASDMVPVLWATQKKGNLLRFDADILLRSSPWREQTLRCRG